MCAADMSSRADGIPQSGTYVVQEYHGSAGGLEPPLSMILKTASRIAGRRPVRFGLFGWLCDSQLASPEGLAEASPLAAEASPLAPAGVMTIAPS